MRQQELIPHLFRTEFSKIVAVLVNAFGMNHIEMAEDIASETFIAALETWPHRGVPANPVAWLYSVARNKARNQFIRERNFNSKMADPINDFNDRVAEIEFTEDIIRDSQLKMMFAVCHPSIPNKSQVGLALRLLCGFGIDEISSAFLTNKEAINKRLFRARAKLKKQNINLNSVSQSEIDKRLEAVLLTIYLLFNEGYCSQHHDIAIRKELCLEAIRLAYLLLDHKATNTPKVNALLALFCFHSSRLEARQNLAGEMVLYHDQDESLWNKALIAKGMYFLHQSSQGAILSKYHLEANIAYWHTVKADSQAKWETVLKLYDLLLSKAYTPIAALNRIYVLSKLHGNQNAIEEAKKINLADNHYYFTLLGELYKKDHPVLAKNYFGTALTMAKSKAEQKVIQNKIHSLGL